MQKNINRSLILCSAVLMILFSFKSYATCKITMGWDNWKPYDYLDERQKLTGIDIDIAKEIATEMGCHITFKKMRFKRLLFSVKNGSIDFIASSTKTADRRIWALFSDPYMNEETALFVRKGESANYPLKTLADIKKINFVLGTNNGSYFGPKLEELLNDSDFSKLIEKVIFQQQNYKKLLRHRIDGYLENKITSILFHREQGSLHKVEIHPLPIFNTPLHFMFSKKSTNQSFLKRFNRHLNALKKNAIYDKIIDKHLKN